MKKLFVFLVSLCLLFSQLTLPEAKQKESSGESSNNYHAIDYEVSQSKTKKAQFRSRSTLPKSYDARTDDYVTSVKNQNPFGDCWAFSAISTAETSALKNGLTGSKGNLDLSELQLAYFFYHRVNDPLENTEGDRNIARGEKAGQPDDYLDNGGNNWLTAMSLSQWPGPVDENKAPYVNNADHFTEFLDADLNYLHTEYAMKDAVFLPDNDKNGIKQAIIDNGSVSGSYFAEEDQFYDKYVYNGNSAVNHSITIVGYNDNISKKLFGPMKPQNDGAWIVKNSWGSRSGDGGYFYLSYDQPLNAVIAYNYMAADQYNHNYFYDGSAGFEKIEGNESLTVANVFQAKGGGGKHPEYLKAVSVGIARSDTNYSIQIYTDLKDLSDPSSGTKVLSQPVTGLKAYEGIYTIELPNKIKLNQNRHFAVIVTLNHKDASSIYAAQERDYGWVFMEERTAPQQSYKLENGKWTDMNDSKTCSRIKALTDSHPSVADAKAEISQSQYTYSGAEIRPIPKVTLDGITLKAGEDYRVSYQNNIKAGSADIIIIGQNEYRGTKKIPFRIQSRSIASVNTGNISSAVYNGKAQTPAVSVKDGSAKLREGTDYTITYSNNINAGQASVAVRGTGNYTGTVTRNFTIVPADINRLSYGSISTKIYNDKAQYPDIRVTNAGTVLKKGKDYTLSYSNHKNVGTAAVTITGKGNYTGRAVKYFKISKRGVNTLNISRVSKRTYTGRSIKPSVSVKYGSKLLKRNADYTLSYGKNKNTGKATVKVTGKGNYTGSVTKTFYIVPRKTKITYAKSKKSRKLTIKYKKAAGASGYEIAYRKKGSKSYKYRRTGKRSYTLSKLSRKKSYQVKVRAYKNVGKTRYYGSYSSQKTIRIR